VDERTEAEARCEVNASRRDWSSVSLARLERAIGRTLRTLPTLRYRGDCLVCGQKSHSMDCSLATLELVLMEQRGKIAPKEMRHYIFRKSQAK